MTDATLRSRFTKLIRSILGNPNNERAPARASRRRPHRRSLSAESLEERTLLAAAVNQYDENVIARNTVDFVAAGSTVTNTEFAANVLNDFRNDRGGVINGSVLSFAGYDYGATQSKTLKLNIAEGTNYGIGTVPVPSASAISLTGAFVSTNFDSPHSYTSFDFEVVGAADERVVEFAVTALSYTGRDYGTVTVTGRLARGGTLSASRAIHEDGSLGDTFYGLTAPARDYFTGFSLSYDSGIEQQLWFDDIGFRTAAVANHAPQAFDDFYSQIEDHPLTVTAAGVLRNDTDADYDTLTAELVDGPAHGTLELNLDGSLTYLPDANFNGLDSFTYRAHDGQGGVSNTATVTLRMIPVADAPIVDDAVFSLDEGSPVDTPVGTVSASDGDGDALTFAIASGNDAGAFAIDAATGAITVADSGPLDYETNPVFQLTVQATDGTGLSGTATIDIQLVDLRESLTVAIDVNPRDDTNQIRLGHNDRIAVVIYSTDTFDAPAEVDLDSLTFGATGDESSLIGHQQGVMYKVRDVDGDGRDDLIVYARTQPAGFDADDTQAVLKGRLLDGTIIQGMVEINVVDHARQNGRQ